MSNIQEINDDATNLRPDTLGRSFSKRGIKTVQDLGVSGPGIGSSFGGDSTGDSDVFERLASSHTLASQAKMVHREASLNSLTE